VAARGGSAPDHPGGRRADVPRRLGRRRRRAQNYQPAGFGPLFLYKYLALSAAELRLPILVPNPAHSQFIARESSEPREETLSLPAARARQLLRPTD
jgi:hypothetical protein